MKEGILSTEALRKVCELCENDIDVTLSAKRLRGCIVFIAELTHSVCGKRVALISYHSLGDALWSALKRWEEVNGSH
ncbi:MAG: hypothetical protein QXI19_12960 [Candidatus Caldarchaeum sp.]